MSGLDRNLRSLEGVESLYFIPSDPLVEDILIPSFSAADKVDCMMGFFSSAVLSDLAPGLASFIENSDNAFRLIISPFLRPEDREAIEAGLCSNESAVTKALEYVIITEDLLEQHTLRCLSYLLQSGRIEIKVALMKEGLFHPKIWLFQQGEDVVVAHGSSNLTRAGIRTNFEQVSIDRSWISSNEFGKVEKTKEQFEQLWAEKEDDFFVIPIPRAIEEKIIKNYPSMGAPSEEEFMRLSNRGYDFREEPTPFEGFGPPPKQKILIPDWLNYEDGEFEHQGRAVAAWCDSGFQGILEMATGSGKTITAMICASRLAEQHQPLLVVVAAPYIPLIQQWCDEIADFSVKPIDLTAVQGAGGRARELNRIKRRFRSGGSDVEVIVVSHKTLCTAEFKAELTAFDCKKLLIADEAHNLGSEGFISDPPSFFEYRLGLSATPIRQYDEEGTDALLAFFGSIVFEFTLEEAIGRCLVEYDYYVHPVELTEKEMDSWYELTAEIGANSWRSAEGKEDKYIAKLLRDRRALLENAENKIPVLKAMFENEDIKSMRHTLIYTSDKNPEQLEAVNRLLNEKGLLFHQLTYEETGNREETARIIKSFQEGNLQVLTAKRVLDEGVNIPQIQKAFILASTTVERQWTQRRGRLLRSCKEIGKTYSEIHDFIALPRDIKNVDKETRSLIESELRRIREFASLARNAGRDDGPLGIIHELTMALLSGGE